MKFNIVFTERIIELSEFKTKFERIKIIASNWRMVVIISVALLTIKVAAEQLVMVIR